MQSLWQRRWPDGSVQAHPASVEHAKTNEGEKVTEFSIEERQRQNFFLL